MGKVAKTLLILNGVAPSSELLSWRYEEANLVVAVDGGWFPLREAQLLPNALIGDFDSVGQIDIIRSQFPEVNLECLDDPNKTDFEKAIAWLEQNDESEDLVVLGGLGKRTDHLLTNLLVSMKIKSKIKVTFDDDHEWIGRVTPSCPLTVSGRKDATLSIIPLCDCLGVNSIGLNWELEDEHFSPSSQHSQSNFCVSDEVTVSCTQGVLFVIIPKG